MSLTAQHATWSGNRRSDEEKWSTVKLQRRSAQVVAEFSNEIDKRFYFYGDSKAQSSWSEEPVHVTVEDYTNTSSRVITGATLNEPFSPVPEIMVSDLQDEPEPLLSPSSSLPSTPTSTPTVDGDLVAMRVTTAMEELITMVEKRPSTLRDTALDRIQLQSRVLWNPVL